ncbi:MAG: DUF2510 domain-containing protein [Actinomycetota bacterium]
MTDSTPGWQADPTGRHDHRYWDGSRWTDDVADAGVAAKDPYEGPADAGPAEDAAPTDAGPAGTEPTAVTPVPEPEPTTVTPTPAADPTAAWPAAGANPPPPSYSGPPPPTVPVTPAAAANASSGSKKGFLIGLGLLVLIALGVGAFLLLGGDDDDDRERIHAGLVSAFNEDDTFTDAQADCLADHIIDELGEDRLKDVDFSADDPPADLEDDLFAAADSGLEACEIDMFGTDGGTDDGATDDGATDDGSTDDSSTDDGATDDDFGTDLGDLGTDSEFGPEFEEMLADIYADSFGISQEKAECLAGKIADAMDSGQLDEEEMMGDIFEYFSDCDISMSEISGG